MLTVGTHVPPLPSFFWSLFAMRHGGPRFVSARGPGTTIKRTTCATLSVPNADDRVTPGRSNRSGIIRDSAQRDSRARSVMIPRFGALCITARSRDNLMLRYNEEKILGNILLSHFLIPQKRTPTREREHLRSRWLPIDLDDYSAFNACVTLGAVSRLTYRVNHHKIGERTDLDARARFCSHSIQSIESLISHGN